MVKYKPSKKKVIKVLWLFGMLGWSVRVYAAYSTDLSVVTAGRDAQTKVTEARVGANIDWIIDYINNGPQKSAANINIPIDNTQAYVVGSLQLPTGWTATYSQNINCTPGSFTYTPVGSNGSQDINVKCIQVHNNTINAPANASATKSLQATSNIGVSLPQVNGGDVFTIRSYQDRVYYINHHQLSNDTTRKQLYCYNIETQAPCIPMAGSPITGYPVQLGVEGIPNVADQLPVSTSVTATSVVINGKLYFPYSDCSPDQTDCFGDEYNDPLNSAKDFADADGGGIMCWDLQMDNYCTGGGLNARGQIKLHDIDISSGTGDYPNGNTNGTTYDIAYNEATQEIFSLANDGSIVCYKLDLGIPCVGQPYATAITNHQQYRDKGNMIIIGDRVYATLSPDPVEVGCILISTKAKCPEFTTTRIIAAEVNGNWETMHRGALFSSNGQLCEFVSQPIDPDYWPDKTAIYCFNPATNTFVQHYTSISGTTDYPLVNYVGDQNLTDRVFIVTFGENLLRCYLTATEQECPGWAGGKPLPNSDDRPYTAYYTMGCLWISSDTGYIYPLDLNTGGTCHPTFTYYACDLGVALDASSFYCGGGTDEKSWDKVVYSDAGVTPAPTVLNASVYDLSNCVQAHNNVTCTGAPLKTANLLLDANHSMDISDISYAAHPQLAVIIDFNYPNTPNIPPSFYLQLKQTDQPQMCLQTVIPLSASLCQTLLTNVCLTSSIDSTDTNNTNNSSQTCLPVADYVGKDGPLSQFGESCVTSSFEPLGEISPVSKSPVPVSYVSSYSVKTPVADTVTDTSAPLDSWMREFSHDTPSLPVMFLVGGTTVAAYALVKTRFSKH